MLTLRERWQRSERLSASRPFTLDLSYPLLKEFMAKQKARRRREVAEPTVFEQARDDRTELGFGLFPFDLAQALQVQTVQEQLMNAALDLLILPAADIWRRL